MPLYYYEKYNAISVTKYRMGSFEALDGSKPGVPISTNGENYLSYRFDDINNKFIGINPIDKNKTYPTGTIIYYFSFTNNKVMRRHRLLEPAKYGEGSKSFVPDFVSTNFSTEYKSYSKGLTLLDTIVSEEGIYPNNSRHSDGYWYVRGSLANATPAISLASPVSNQTLYENDTFNIQGSATDTDVGNSVTVRYQINTNTARAIKAFVSTGAIESFNKQLTFKGGSLYDDNTLIATNLMDGVPHTLKVWATDDQGGQSAIVERTFYVVPNRAPRLEVTPPTIEGNIDSDTFTVSGTYADDDKNEVIISYRINGSISKEVARGTDGTFDFTLSLSQLKNGNNTISVEAIDSYGAKTSRTIKLNKNTIATPLLQSTVRYLIQPPKGSAQAVLLWLQRDQDLAVTASLHMGMKGEAEAFTLLEPTNTAPLRDNATILEDEFYHEADGAKDHIILQLDMKRSSVESTAAIHLISGVFE